MQRTTRKAFTLIELLVVIAIIAILAAILFPVFAQARQMARGASSQSNIKQISLGVLMYVQDYDEQFPMFQSWPTTGGQVCWGSCSGGEWDMWTFDIAPYLKNSQIYSDPLYGSSSESSSWLQSIYPDYGYNYTTLSPTFANTTPWQFPGTSDAAINAPAGTVMFTGKFDNTEMPAYWYGAGTMLNEGNAEAPDCSDIPAVCWTDWTPLGNDSIITTIAAGKDTGGDSIRKQGNMNVAFVDGHAKFMQAAAAAIGTNWTMGAGPGTIHITNSNTYMWQVIP